MFERVLIIDNTPKGGEKGWRTVFTKEDVDELYQTFLFVKEHPTLRLDCRQITDQTHLLKFLEEYRGDIHLYVREPVAGTIISRFQYIYKEPQINKGVFLESFFIRNVRASIREKVYNLFFGGIVE